jgi:hypothetical protein
MIGFLLRHWRFTLVVIVLTGFYLHEGHAMASGACG